MNAQSETSSINSADRRSLLKAWGELDVGFSEGPVDYLWLFYTAFYTAKGIPRAKSFYVTRLSIWKEPAMRMSFFHEYLVATIRSDSRTDKREYYLLFERTAGQLNTDKKKEEDLGRKPESGQEDEEQRNEEEVNDFSFAPDRNLEDKVFGTGPQHWSHQSDDEGAPKSASTQGSTSPQSEGIAGMLGMFFAAKDLVSNASESSSKDLILADDRYQLIDRPYRRSSDIEVAWIVLGRPDGINPDSVENLGAQTVAPTNESTPATTPNPLPSHHSQDNLSQHNPALTSVQRTASNNSAISSNHSIASSIGDVPTNSDPPDSPHSSQATTFQHDLNLGVRPRTISKASSVPHASRSSHPLGAHRNKRLSVNPSASTPSLPSRIQAGDQPPPISNPSPNDAPHSTFLDQLPFASSNIDDGEAPISSGPLGDYLNTRSLSTEAFHFSGHPLLRVNTSISNVTRSSRFRLRRRSSFSTIQYDSLPPLPSRNYIYLYELVVLACRLHKCTSLYRIFTRNCYWFAGMIFHVIRVFTGIDASISGEGDQVDRMKPSTEVMLWINSGRMGTFLRSIRIVKAPRLFTVYALIRKWHGAIVRFEDQVSLSLSSLLILC